MALTAGANPGDSVKRKSTGKMLARNFAAPVVLIGLGVHSAYDGKIIDRHKVYNWRTANHPEFHSSLDDYLQYAPIGFVYGLDWAGVKAKNDLINRTLLLAKSEILMGVVIRILKISARVERPHGGNFHSFPSGHTGQAFVAATFLHKELGQKSIWFSIGGYTLATSVGVMRILNNSHWVSDVLAGAGIGILSTNIVYMTHRYRWGKKSNLTVLPTYSDGPGLYLALKLGN
jgi:membrane-associated phospholipid phosphatase